MADKNKGVFGIPIRQVTTKKELEALLASKPKFDPKDAEKELKGFTYVPELNLYVADKVSMKDNSWYECKQKTKKRGSRMLTPAEFWIYYDYCVENRPDIVKDCFGSYVDGEWLDALVESKNLIINPEVKENDYLNGKIYLEIVLKKHGNFKREDINPKTGLPASLRKKGKWNYHRPPKNDLAAVNRDLGGDGLILSLSRPPDFFCSYIGVRECFSVEYAKKKGVQKHSYISK